MGISDRIQGSLEHWADLWAARLGKWMATLIGAGVEQFADTLGKKQAQLIGDLLKRVESTGKVPPEIQKYLDELKSPTGESAGAGSGAIAQAIVGGSIGRIIDAIMLPMAYTANKMTRNVIISADQMIREYQLGHVDRAMADAALAQYGFSEEAVPIILDQAMVRFPSDIVGPAWLRDPAKYGKFWDDVKGMGISPERLELIKEMTYRVPGVQDVIRYVVKEAYNPAIVREFGQDQEYPTVAEEDARKAGVRPDHLLKEWIAHWNLPSVGQGFEMLHRGIIKEAQLDLLLKAVDIMPFWRDKLTAMSWSLPGRIEVRMMAQLGLVGKAFIMDILKKDGLAEEYRSIVADMNIVRGIRSDIQTRYTKGWLDSQGVKDELTESGLSPQIADRLYQWIVTNAKGDRTAAEKDLTKAEIIKGVQEGVIGVDEGIQRLVDMGYDEMEADYIMAINLPQEAEKVSEALKTRVDTIRRQRRKRIIPREAEITQLVTAGITPELAQEYALNDDTRLAAEPKPPTEAQLTKAEIVKGVMINKITWEQGVDGLVALGYDLNEADYILAVNIRPRDEAQLTSLAVDIDSIRRRRRSRAIGRDQEITSLTDIGVAAIVARAYADNDDLRLVAAK